MCHIKRMLPWRCFKKRAQSEYFKLLYAKLQVGQRQRSGVFRFAAQCNSKIKWIRCVSLSDIFLSAHRARCLPAVVQASDALSDTGSCLFPEQAEAQLSAKTQGTPTVTGSVFTQHREMFDKDIFKHTGSLAGVHVRAFGLCSCDSSRLCLLLQGECFSSLFIKKKWFECSQYQQHNQVIWWFEVFFSLSSAGEAGIWETNKRDKEDGRWGQCELCSANQILLWKLSALIRLFMFFAHWI